MRDVRTHRHTDMLGCMCACSLCARAPPVQAATVSSLCLLATPPPDRPARARTSQRSTPARPRRRSCRGGRCRSSRRRRWSGTRCRARSCPGKSTGVRSSPRPSMRRTSSHRQSSLRAAHTCGGAQQMRSQGNGWQGRVHQLLRALVRRAPGGVPSLPLHSQAHGRHRQQLQLSPARPRHQLNSLCSRERRVWLIPSSTSGTVTSTCTGSGSVPEGRE